MAHVGPAGMAISRSAVQALHDAHGLAAPGLVTIASRLDIEFVGGALHTSGTASDPPDVHQQVVVTLRAGATDLAAVLTELVRHAVLAEPAAVGLVRAAIDAARSTDPAAALAALLDGAGTTWMQTPNGIALHEAAAILATDIGAPAAPALLLATRAQLDPVREGRRRAALAYACCWLVGEEEFVELVEAIATDDRPDMAGWPDRAATIQGLLESRHDDAERHARAAILGAVAAADMPLESHATLGLANLRSTAGDTVGAIALQTRALGIAITAEAWRSVAIGAANLAAMQVEALDLAGARRVIDRLVATVDDKGLLAYREEALLHAARIARMSGDALRARALMAQLDEKAGEGSSPADDAYKLVRRADLAVALGLPDAAGQVAEARRLIDLAGMPRQELDMVLIECAAAAPEVPLELESRIPELLGTAEVAQDAQALTWLARRVAIDGSAQARTLLDVAIERVRADRGPILELAVEEATIARSGAAAAWMRMADVAGRWRRHGFRTDAAIAEASAGVLAGRADQGNDAARLLDAAHGELALLGLVQELARVRVARARLVGGGNLRELGDPAETAFGSLRSADTDELRSLAIRRVVPAGSAFPAGHACAIASGVAVVDHAPVAGQVGQPIDVLGPGAVTGLEPVADPHSRSPLVVRALVRCTVDAVPADALAALGERDPVLAMSIARAIAARATRLARLLARRSDPSIERRVAGTLVDLHDAIGSTPGDAGLVLSARIPRQLVGDLANTTREGASRCMSRLTREGVLASAGHSIVIVDLTQLQVAAVRVD